MYLTDSLLIASIFANLEATVPYAMLLFNMTAAIVSLRYLLSAWSIFLPVFKD